MKKSTFQYISNSNVITGSWLTDEGEQLSPSDTFKTRSKQDSVMTRWQTDEEEHIPLYLDSIFSALRHQSAT